MKKIFIVLCWGSLCTLYSPVQGQGFQEEISTYREHYKEKFATSAKSPIPESDLPYLRFFAPDSAYRVKAVFKATPNSEPFKMPTYSGITKDFVKYGEFLFTLHGTDCRLSVYKNLTLPNLPIYKNHIFVLFKDLTNTEETYGGGRYIDMSTTDIQGTSVLLDFNKAYNPYCAYSEGFNCPIPPRENHLNVRIEAGEQNFGKEH